VLLTSCSSISHEQEAANILSVTGVFENLLESRKLALPGASEIEEFSTFRLPDGSRRRRYLRSFSAQDSDCNALYVVEVKFGSRKARCLFCKDGETPRFLSQHICETGVWREIRAVD
jgi:hypothetical protein